MTSHIPDPKERSMSESEAVEAAIRGFLIKQQKNDDFGTETRLFDGGIGLDSLQTAELSVTLEDELGRDPFSEGEMPQSVGEIIDFYER
jgi:acyl carrier protein